MACLRITASTWQVESTDLPPSHRQRTQLSSSPSPVSNNDRSSPAAAMANRVCAGVVATAATAALLTAGGVDGHAHQQFPMSRQYSRSNDFYDHK